MKIIKRLVTLVMVLMVGVPGNGLAATADEILHRMEDHRFIDGDLEMTIRVESYLDEHLETLAVMKGYVSGGKLTSIVFLEPQNMRDRKLLADGDDIQLIIPKVKNPIRITPAQRLTGGISYSDLAAVSYEKDYDVKLLGEEEIVGMTADGQETASKRCYHLELSAKRRGLNYHKINFWVDKQGFLPVRADFFALSGKKMTVVYYSAPREINGQQIMTKMFLFDQLNPAKHFIMEYSDINVTS